MTLFADFQKCFVCVLWGKEKELLNKSKKKKKEHVINNFLTKCKLREFSTQRHSRSSKGHTRLKLSTHGSEMQERMVKKETAEYALARLLLQYAA